MYVPFPEGAFATASLAATATTSAAGEGKGREKRFAAINSRFLFRFVGAATTFSDKQPRYDYEIPRLCVCMSDMYTRLFQTYTNHRAGERQKCLGILEIIDGIV